MTRIFLEYDSELTVQISRPNQGVIINFTFANFPGKRVSFN